MEMKKVACAVVFAAASISAVMAVEAPKAAAQAPGPSSGAVALGSMVGVTVASFVAYYLHF